MDPLTTQVGGTHYSDMKMQPVELAHIRGYDCCTFSILKYVSRHRVKNGRQDLEKALHFLELRRALLARLGPAGGFAHCPLEVRPQIVTSYCRDNDLPTMEALIVARNDLWHDHPNDKWAIDELDFWIRQLITETYGAKK